MVAPHIDQITGTQFIFAALPSLAFRRLSAESPRPINEELHFDAHVSDDRRRLNVTPITEPSGLPRLGFRNS
jgi:hypothetical protein